MKHRICRIVVALSLAHSLWSQTTPTCSEENPPDEAVLETRVRPVSWKQLVPNIAKDQKQIWTFPLRIGQGNNWAPALAVSAITAGLVIADPHDTPYFRRTTSFNRFNSAVSTNTTALGTAIVPISLYLAGMIRKDSYAKETALLAGEAIANAEILTIVMHMADRRIRPKNLPDDNYRDTWFKNKLSLVKGSGSFPSGHSMAAFALATVLSRRYPSHRWVPYMAHGIATIASFSRITSADHFTSDVFFGAAAGYSISRFSVLRR